MFELFLMAVVFIGGGLIAFQLLLALGMVLGVTYKKGAGEKKDV